MKSLTYKTYPSGYIGSADVEPCQCIDKLHAEYSAINTSADLAELRTKVIQFALSQFGALNGFKGFVHANINEAELTELQRRFLIDTIRFITLGEREINITAWQDLIPSSLELDIKSIKGSDILSKEIGLDDVSIGLWLEKDGGFLDMLWSLKIIFGSINKESF